MTENKLICVSGHRTVISNGSGNLGQSRANTGLASGKIVRQVEHDSELCALAAGAAPRAPAVEMRREELASLVPDLGQSRGHLGSSQPPRPPRCQISGVISAHLEVPRTERRGRRCSHLRTPSLRPAPAAPGRHRNRSGNLGQPRSISVNLGQSRVGAWPASRSCISSAKPASSTSRVALCLRRADAVKDNAHTHDALHSPTAPPPASAGRHPGGRRVVAPRGAACKDEVARL